MNCVGLADALQAGHLFVERNGTLTAEATPQGILKADWFAKHRQRRPAVAVVLLDREEVAGDPGSWAAVCGILDAVRVATRQRGARVVLAVVQQEGSAGEELEEDHVGHLCRKAGIEQTQLVYLPRSLGQVGLGGLARAAHEAAVGHYRDATARVLNLHSEKRSPPPEAAVRTFFKAAAYCEFRCDWPEALRHYQSAYSCLHKLPAPGPPMPLQRWAEVLHAAELLNLKVLTLLLAQHRTVDALQQFVSHARAYRCPPLALPPGPLAHHLSWLARQHHALADKLASTSPPPGAAADHLSRRGVCAAYHYLNAALVAIERRKALQQEAGGRSSAGHGGGGDVAAGGAGGGGGGDAGGLVEGSGGHDGGGGGGAAAAAVAADVIPGKWLGQVVAKQAGSPDVSQRLTERQYEEYMMAQQVDSDASELVLQLLGRAHEEYKAMPMKNTRLMYHIGALMGTEQLVAGELATAWKLLDAVAGVYRREGWHRLLANALRTQHTAAQRLGLGKEEVALALELSALRGGGGGGGERALQDCCAALQGLQELAARGEDGAMDHSTPATAQDLGAGAGKQQHQQQDGGDGAEQQEELMRMQGPPTGFYISAAQPNLGSCVALAYGIAAPRPVEASGSSQPLSSSVAAGAANSREPVAGGAAAAAVGEQQRRQGQGEEEPITVGVAFWSNLPLGLPVARVSVRVSDPQGTREVLCELLDWPPASVAEAEGRADDRAADAEDGIAGGPEAEAAGGADNFEAAPDGAEVAAGDGDGGDCMLQPGRWQRAVARVATRCPGRMAVEEVVLASAAGPTPCGAPSLVWQLQSFAAGGAGPASGGGSPIGQPLRGPWATQPAFAAASRVELGRAWYEVPFRRAPAELLLKGLGFAVQGEALRMAVEVQAASQLTDCRLLVQAKYAEGQAEAELNLGPGAPPELHASPCASAGGSTAGPGQDAGPPCSGMASAPGQLQLGLGAMAAGSSTSVPLEMKVPAEGQISVAATLTYRTAEVPGQELTAQQRRELVAERPFRLSSAASSAPGTFVVLDLPQADDMLPRTSSSSAPSAASSASNSPTAAAVAAAAAAAAAAALAEAADARQVLAAGLPFVVAVHVRASAPCELQLEGAELVLPSHQEGPAQAVADGGSGSVVEGLLSPASSAASPSVATVATASGRSGLTVLDCSLGPLAPPSPDGSTPGRSVALRRGDVYSFVFRLRHDAPADALPLGALRLTWRRAPGAGDGDGSSSSAGPAAAAQTLLPLPIVSFAPARLVLALEAPAALAAGSPFDLAVRMSNPTPLPQAVSFAIGDSHGFVLSGAKSVTAQCPPRQAVRCVWRMVPYAAGALRLPDLTATVQRYGHRVLPLTAAHRVFVAPAGPQPQQAPPAAAPVLSAPS